MVGEIMLQKIVSVSPQNDYLLIVKFENGETKMYDAKNLFGWESAFGELKDVAIFNTVRVANNGIGLIWADRIELSCDEIYNHGISI